MRQVQVKFSFSLFLHPAGRILTVYFFSLFMVIQSQNESQPLYSNPGPWVVYLVGIGSPSKVCLHSHLACEESPSVCQVSKVCHQLHFIEDYTCVHSFHYYAIFENLLLQAWDLIFGYLWVICLHWSLAQEDLVSLLYSQPLPYDLIKAHLLTLLRSCLCHKSSTWLLLILMPTHLCLIHAYTCFVITFLIWKSGDWIEVLTPTLISHYLPFLEVKWLNWRYLVVDLWTFPHLRSVITRLRLSLHEQPAIPLVLVWIREPGCKSHLLVTMGLSPL